MTHDYINGNTYVQHDSQLYFCKDTSSREVRECFVPQNDPLYITYYL